MPDTEVMGPAPEIEMESVWVSGALKLTQYAV
jgi:hypothetical protein